MDTAHSNATGALAAYVLASTPASLPANVLREAKRSWLNITGCALGGARHPTMDLLDDTLAEATGPGVATLLGRGRKSDVLHATLLNCYASSVYSYDDTHADAIIHPAGPVFAAVLALAERNRISGQDALHAFTLGVEISCRLSKAISVPPAKGNIAWSQSGVASGVGVALAAGKLLGLDGAQLRSAIGIAASQAAGIRSLHATMCVPLMPSQGGQTGLRAALLAAKGFTGGTQALERRYGYLTTFCQEANLDALLGELGTRFEILRNTYKPYPCGIVIHPMLDACLELRKDPAVTPANTAKVDIKASAGAMALCNNPLPPGEFEAHVSLHHWCATALIHGHTGIDVLFDKYVQDPAIRAFQSKITAVQTDGIAHDGAVVTITLADGTTREKTITNGIGSTRNPMTDAQLDAKFAAMAEPVIGADRTRATIANCWNLDTMPDAGDLARGAA
jgi:2-methylcitrate dehydratase PrpD